MQPADDVSAESPFAYRLLRGASLRKRGALLLDRDGVINHRIVDGYVTERSELKFCEPFLEAFAQFSFACDAHVAIVSNQACIGKGLLGRVVLDDLMVAVTEELRARGIDLSGWFVCPHVSAAGCTCRKPQPGLLTASAELLGFALERSCFIGDSESDRLAARNAGCGFAQVDAAQPASFFAARECAQALLAAPQLPAWPKQVPL